MNEKIVKRSCLIFTVFVATLAFILCFSFLACNNPAIQSSPIKETLIVPTDINISGLPSTISSVDLQITGEGMDPITPDIASSDTSLTLEVPAGTDRTFDLTITSPSATFAGSATEDLTAGEVIEITLPLSLSETKIIIPDADNNRIIQIDTIDGDGWTEVNATDLGYTDPLSFLPYDVDFDNRGRIYIANYYDGDEEVIRINDITHTNKDTIRSLLQIKAFDPQYIWSIAVDRNNGYLYTGDDNGVVNKTDLDGNLLHSYGDVSGNSYKIYGLAVDNDGYIYASYYNNDTYMGYVNKLHPDTGDEIASYTTEPDHYPWDVMYSDPYIYIAVYQDYGGGEKVVRLSKDLTGPTELPGKPGGGDNFIGPRRFLAVTNKKITLIDEYAINSGDAYNRLVTFDGIEGTGWETLTAGDIGKSAFSFFNLY